MLGYAGLCWAMLGYVEQKLELSLSSAAALGVIKFVIIAVMIF
jgi:hypothetical protein